ncbi:phosphate ABC transporter permease subunit PstC [Halothiobacillus diazotrophicus]|uniref:Phosphate transport system permease protein n=1 Tax=Halothiobacillus diazotrophicus TaxID=1860122 RepID=A0A191ZJX4_9GAMM|nr:phosphate ABC transporter permease subunit PstC [Halothiobacillus diazotrophicus]ANJ68147.1 phosphate ABC transporter permease subunit PstC [Halothiobacillus diazotrophicus]
MATPEEQLILHRQLQAKSSGVLLDRIFKGSAFSFAALVLIVLFGIMLMLFKEAWPTFAHFGFGFFASAEWDAVNNKYGAIIPIIGTLVTSLIAVVIGVPVSFGIAIFITLMAPNWMKRPVGIAIELLAAVPSIIYGMWGLFYFAPWFANSVQPIMTDTLGELPVLGQFFQGPPIGVSIFTAGVVLAIMIIPFIASVMRDMFEIVPTTLKESAYAMGSTTWEVVWKVILPYTKAGVVGGIILGLGRAMGETMAVAFVVGNSLELNTGLFYPGATIASTMANEFNEASGLHMSSLIALGLILFIITFLVLSIAKWFLMILERAHQGTST